MRNRILLLFLLLIFICLSLGGVVLYRNILSSLAKNAPTENDKPILVRATSKSPTSTSQTFVLGEVLVKYKDTRNTGMLNVAAILSKKALAIEQKFGVTHTKTLSTMKIARFKKEGVTKEQTLALVNQLNDDPEVEYAEPNYYVYASAIPNDTRFQNSTYDYMWGLDNRGKRIYVDTSEGGTTGPTMDFSPGKPDADIDAPEAWDLVQAHSSQNTPVVVAVIDTGVQYNHSDLGSNMWDGSGGCKDENGVAISGGCPHHGWDFVSQNGNLGDNNPMDEHGHGTHVAGTIAAVSNNETGVTGISYDNKIKIMAVRALNAEGSGDIVDIITAVEFARQNGAKVINASFGITSASNPSQSLNNAIQGFNGLFVTAAGNENNNNDNNPTGAHSWPCDYSIDHIICVAATTQHDTLASFSNYGSTSVDVGAPGQSILSSFLTDDGASYAFINGTSMASPHVAGLVAAVWSYNSGLSRETLKSAIMENGDVLSALSETVSGKRINLHKTLVAVGTGDEVGEDLTGTPTPTPTSTTPPACVDAGGACSTNDECCSNVCDADVCLESATPLFSPSAGTYLNGVRVTLSGQRTATGEKIYYNSSATATCNAPSILYTNPISISTTTTLSAILCMDNVPTSEAQSQRYTIVSTTGLNTQYFADGDTSNGQGTYLTLRNTENAAATVYIQYFTENGSIPAKKLTLNAYNIETLLSNEVQNDVGSEKKFSILIASPQKVLAERYVVQHASASINPGGRGGVGTTQPTKSQHFAYGSNENGYTTRLAVVNPQGASLSLKVIYLFGQTNQTYEVTYTIPSYSRYVIDTSTDTQLVSKSFTMTLSSSSAFVAERIMSWNNDAHLVSGTSVQSNWRFPFGSTKNGQKTMLSLFYPPVTNTAAAADVTYYLSDTNETRTIRYVLNGAKPQAYFDISADVGTNKDVAITVKADKPIVAEVNHYWNSDSISNVGGYSILGYTGDLGESWELVYADTRREYTTVIPVLNISDYTQAIMAQGTPEGSATSFTKYYTVSPLSAYAIQLKNDMGEFLLKTTVTGQENIVIGKTTFWDVGGVVNAAGYGVLGIKK